MKFALYNHHKLKTMETKIVYDDQQYNTGVIHIGSSSYEYGYDTDIKELIANVLEGLNIDYEIVAFNFEEEE